MTLNIHSLGIMNMKPLDAIFAVRNDLLGISMSLVVKISVSLRTHRIREVLFKPGIIIQLADGDPLCGIFLQHSPNKIDDFR